MTLAVLEEARRLGFDLRAEGDKLHVRHPGPRPAETPRIMEELRQQKAAVLAALTDADVTAASSPTSPVAAEVTSGVACPSCGTTPDELAAVRARRALAEAFDAWDAHARTCNAGCTPARLEACDEGQRLRDAYFDAWTRWLAAVGEGANADGRGAA